MSFLAIFSERTYEETRRRAGRSLRYAKTRRPRRLGAIAVFALLVMVGAVGAALYDRDLAPQSFVKAFEPVQDGLAMAFGNAVPLFADAVGIGEDTLTGRGEVQATLGAIVDSGDAGVRRDRC